MNNIISEDKNLIIGSSDTKYVQSANSLFHFMKKIEYLKTELEQKCMVPRYFDEDASFYNIQGLSTMAYPMICFCDIKLHTIFPHSEVYGNYAIAFSKDFCINKSIQPITYLNDKSTYFEKIRGAIITAVNCDNDDVVYEMLSDQLVYSMSYTKPLIGIQKGQKKNFHDEQEWRYIPDLSLTEMPYFIMNSVDKGDLKENYNETLKYIDKGKLEFDYSDVQYLFVENKNDKTILIDFINSLDIDESDKYNLISNILVLDTIRGDL